MFSSRYIFQSIVISLLYRMIFFVYCKVIFENSKQLIYLLLHGLKNVIVFPMDGPRPHAMEMSGGDLDGDIFWICRHPKLIFQSNEEPFDYQGQEDEAKKHNTNNCSTYHQ